MIRARLDRLQLGHLGNFRGVGNGVCELKIHHGPGYRIYFGLLGESRAVLLCGGDKSTQFNDIRKAQDYWTDFRSRV